MQAKSQPKLVDKWIFAHLSTEEIPKKELEEGEGPQGRKVDARVEISVFIIKHLEEIGSAPHATKQVEFVVTCAQPEFRFVGTDIESLRRAAFSECSQRYAITWSDYFLVSVHPSSFGEGIRTGLEFGYNTVQKGVTWDGKELLKQRLWGGHIEIKPWPGQFTDRGGQVIACISDTPTNKKALEEFGRRIDVLRGLITDSLRPEFIERTLSDLSQFKLLPEEISK